MQENNQENNQEITHILFCKTVGGLKKFDKWIVKYRGPESAFIATNDVSELPQDPRVRMCKYEPRVCRHYVVKCNSFDNTIEKIQSFVNDKVGDDKVECTVTRDKRDYKPWFHINLDTNITYDTLVGEFALENGGHISISKWMNRCAPGILDGYLDRLLNHNFDNDEYLKKIVIRYKGWIPLQTKQGSEFKGLLDFKWPQRNRVTPRDTRDSLKRIAGGRWNYKNKNMVNTTTVWEWWKSQTAESQTAESQTEESQTEESQTEKSTEKSTEEKNDSVDTTE